MPRTEFEHLREQAVSKALEELEAEKVSWKEEKEMMLAILGQLIKRVKELSREVRDLSAMFNEKAQTDEAITTLLARLRAEAARQG